MMYIIVQVYSMDRGLGEWVVIRPADFMILIVQVMFLVLPILPVHSDHRHLFIDKG